MAFLIRLLASCNPLRAQTKTQMKKRLGDLNEVTNKNPHPAAAKAYNHVRVQAEGGLELSLLFTDYEIQCARKRALKNPEDLPKVGWLRNLLD